MKQLLFSLGFVCLIAMILPACAPAPESEPEAAPEPVFDQAAEEAAIRAWIEERAAAYNRHDVRALGAQLDENFENWTGSQKGRTAYEQSAAENFERYKDLQVKLLEVIGIVFVTPDVAVLKYRTEFTGGTDEDGKPLPPERDLSASVLVRKDGKWLRATQFSRTEE